MNEDFNSAVIMVGMIGMLFPKLSAGRVLMRLTDRFTLD